ncbi:beta strand repeat-containing protein [Burkholderia orbicola]
MGKLVESSQWEEDLYQIETADPVEGGPDGVSNKQAKQLGGRTRYLKAQVEQSQSGLAQHVAAADPHTQYATKSDLAARLAALVGQSPQTLDTLKELADALGNDPNFATTIANQLGLKAPINSPVFTGTPKGPTQPQFDNTTLLATTAFVQGALGNFRNQIGLSAATTLNATAWGNAYTLFGGSPYNVTLPPLSSGVNGAAIRFSNIGSTAYTLVGAGSDSIFNGTTSSTLVLNPGDTVTLVSSGVWVMFGGSMSLLASGALTGPGWRTQSQFDSSTKLATTAFVQRALGNFSVIKLVQGTNTTLDSTAFGSAIQIGGASCTITLPSGTGVQPGSTIRFYAQGAVGATYTIQATGGAFIYAPGAGMGVSNTTLTLNSNDTVELTNRSGNEWDVTGGSWIISNEAVTLGPNANGTTASAGDNSTRLATTAFVKQAGESYSSIQGIAATASLNSGHVGTFIWAYGAGITLTLPPAAGVPNGATITIGTPGGVTIKSNASETITNQYGAGSNTLALNAGEQAQFVSNGGAWYLSSYTTVLGTTPAAGDNSTKLATTAFVQQAIRTRLTQNVTFYVSTSTGNDSNNGLSSGAAFATIQRAWDVIKQAYDLNGYVATISVASGTYTSGLNAAGQMVGNTLGTSGVIIVGNSATIIVGASLYCFNASQGARYTIQGFTMQSSGSSANAIQLTDPSSSIVVGPGNTFGTFTSGTHMNCSGGQISVQANYTISGGAAYHILASNPGSTTGYQPGLTVTVTGTPTFSQQFAVSQFLGLINAAGTTFSGSATGTRYLATINGVINTNGGGASFFPGSAAGSTSSGGIYA